MVSSRYWVAVALSICMAASAVASPQEMEEAVEEPVRERLLQLSQSFSCSPRRYCSRGISSCREARWYYQNCSWGGALDGDNDGVPCENLC
jgi:hypothetical protein